MTVLRTAFAYPCQRLGDSTMRGATKRRGETFARAKRFSPVFSTPREAAKAFQPVVLPFSAGELAFTTNKETAKCWRAGRAFPSGLNLMCLMAQFPTVRAWVNEQVEAMGANPDDPRFVAEITQRVMQEMQEMRERRE